jgi:hypothetical protein
MQRPAYQLLLGSSAVFDWHRVNAPAFEDQAIVLTHLIRTPAVFVALGSDADSGAGVIWVSADGERWDRVALEAGAFDGAVTGAVVSDDGLVVTVGATDSPGSHGVPRAWYAMP